MSINQFVLNWAVKRIRKDYTDDIALVMSHNDLSITENEDHFSFFVPSTKRGDEFARTFILEGVGVDIWSLHWDRLERFADLSEYNIGVLADAKILYSRTPEDAQRFEQLQKRQRDNLNDPAKARKCALESYKQAKSIYLDMLFAQESDVKLGAGYVLDYLARSIAFVNHSYFKRSQTDQLNELKAMKDVPEHFTELYLQVIQERSCEQQKKRCYQLISIVQKFLSEHQPTTECKNAEERNFQDLSDWYAELAYTWLRIRHYAEQKNFIRVYMWGIFLQKELNDVCGDFGLKKMELMSSYDPDDLSKFVRCADQLEKQIREIITAEGGKINEYSSTEEFLHEV